MKNIKDKININQLSLNPFSYKEGSSNNQRLFEPDCAKMRRVLGLVRCVLFLLLLFGLGKEGTLFSQSISTTANGQFLTNPFENKVFIEEQGQFKKSLAEKKINIPGTVLFAVNNSGFQTFFTNTGITFLFSKTEKTHQEKENEGDEKVETEGNDKKPMAKWEVVNMQWVNASPSMKVKAKEKVKNYYTYGRYADNSQYDHVSAYKKLFYSNIYEGVDAEFEIPEKGGIKYQFIVHAGFNIPAIAYRMDGTKNLFLDKEGNLHIEALLGNLIDKAPVAFTKSSNMPASYSVTGNLVEINAGNNTLPLAEDLIIDPWIIDPAIPSADKAYDIQEDSTGNVYVFGGPTSNYQAKKYNSTGVLLWTYTTTQTYYGDFAVGNLGSVYLAEGLSPSKVTKLNNAGAVIYSVAGSGELWRLDFNRSKTILSIGGYFNSNINLGKLDTATGAITDQLGYSLETRSISTDCNGDIYSLHPTFGYSGDPATNVINKTNADFTPGGSVSSGFSLYESGPAYTSSNWSGINAIAVNGPYIYVYDGAVLKRFDKGALSFINSVTVPNGVFYSCSGIAFDYCGNIYVGTMSTIEKYDMSLNYISSMTAPGAVYDVILARNGDILACGNTFVGNFGPTCPFPPQLVVSATSTNVSCNPGTATILATGGTSPYSYLWQPGGQTTAMATNLTPGTYTYIVNDAFCQSKQDSVVVILTSPLLLSIGTVNNESCLNTLDGSATVNGSGGTGPYTYSWNTNPVQTTASVTGLPAGSYVATVTDADICTDTVHVTIGSNPNPVAAFSNTSVCYNSATQFTDNSTTTSGTISSRTWDFGDGSALNSLQNPAYSYLNPGSFNVTLIVNNSAGCADTVTKSVPVYFNPVAGFIYTDVCFGDSMHFTNTSSVDNSSSISTYLWSFGDASPTSSIQNQAHYYSAPGTYTVTLVTTTIDGCSNAISIPVNVFDAPTTAFTFSNTCLIDSAIFTNTSLNPVMGSTANWSWNFGDGSPLLTLTGFQTLLGVLYAAPGNYQVTLITYSSNLGCSDTLKDSITVFPMPVVNFGSSNVCLNQVTNFNDSSTVSNGSIASWSWNFGDGSPIVTVQNPTHLYANPGNFSVSLIISTNNGCNDTMIKTVMVHPLPDAQFSSANVCKGSVTQFNDLSTIPSTDTLQSWAWNYGDGSPVFNNQNTSHLYAAMGSYTVQLLVISNFGCIDSISKISIVNPNPLVIFTAPDTVGCEPLCINFQNVSSIATGSNAGGLWDFGDGGPISSILNPVHCYTNDSVYSPNSFSVTLTVTSDSGCVSTITKNNYITVYPNPVANLSVQPQTAIITDPVISITNLSTGGNFWNWNFGDSDTSTAFNPLPHTYPDTGIYIITLITSTQYNCADTILQTIIIEPDFTFYIPNAFTPNEDGVNDGFSGNGINILNYEMSIFDRWGNLIFFSDDINKAWDGRANHGSEIAQSDVYIYSFKVTDIRKKKHTYKGIVTLVR